MKEITLYTDVSWCGDKWAYAIVSPDISFLSMDMFNHIDENLSWIAEVKAILIAIDKASSWGYKKVNILSDMQGAGSIIKRNVKLSKLARQKKYKLISDEIDKIYNNKNIIFDISWVPRNKNLAGILFDHKSYFKVKVPPKHLRVVHKTIIHYNPTKRIELFSKNNILLPHYGRINTSESLFRPRM